MRYTWYHKLGFGLLAALLLALASHLIGNFLVHADRLAKPAFAVASGAADKPAPTAEAPAPEATAAKPQAKAMAAMGDVEAGLKVFRKCKACHTSDQGGANRVGPNLWGIVGRAKGGADGYKYSEAMKSKGGEWTLTDLEGFLANPKGFLPGTKMSFRGITNPGDLAAVIAFLNSLSAQPKPLQ